MIDLPEEKLDELILTLQRALKEVFEVEEFAYFVGDEHFYLLQGKLNRQKQEFPTQGFDCFKLGRDPVSGQTHLLFAKVSLLNSNRLDYFELILKQYQMTLSQTLAGTKPKSLEAEEMHDNKPIDGSIRAKYRKQKEVILALEHFARKQNPQSRLLKDLEDLPDLEEEIIQFQNKLIQDLALFRKRAFDARQEQERMSRFIQIFIDELSSRAALSIGLMTLFQKQEKGLSEQTEQLALAQVKSLKTFCDAIVEAIESEHQRGFLTPEYSDIQSLLHQSLTLMQESEEGQSMQVNLDPSLSQHKVRVDVYMMRRCFGFYFQFMTKLHSLSGSREPLVLQVSSQVKEEGPVIRLVASGIVTGEEVLAQLQEPKSLYHTLNYGGVAPSMLFYFMKQALNRHQGSIKFLVRESGDIDCIVRLQDLEDSKTEGEKKA